MIMVGLSSLAMATAVALGISVPSAQTGTERRSGNQSMAGVVKTVSTSSLTLEYSGHEITFALDRSTRVIAKGRARDLLRRIPERGVTDIIKAGDRVTVNYRQSDSKMNAVEVIVTSTAERKPDFSGEWTLNRQASTLSPGASAVRSGVLRIEHREPMFRCILTVVGDGKPIESAYELLSDSREVTTSHQGRSIVSSLRWDGDTLVFTSGITGPNLEMTVSFRYELHESGRRLRAVEQIRGGGRDQDNVWVFERP
jgi:hypothetical protein